MTLRIAALFVTTFVMLFGGYTIEADSSSDAEILERISLRMQSAKTATSLLFFTQDERRVTFKSMHRIYPTRSVEVNDNVYVLNRNERNLNEASYEVDGVRYTVGDFLASPYIKGLIVIQDNEILLEKYSDDHSETTRWVSFSVSKSVTSMLIGAAIKDGFIQDINEPVTYYLPRLRGTPYETTTIKDLLAMSSGIEWNEDYSDPDSDVAQAGGANGIELVSYLAQLSKKHTPGEVFNYNTGETNLVGEILRSAIGNNASTYLQHKIWQPFGMEFSATWLLGGTGGGETGGCCISATLRDYARLGIFAMRNGVLPNGTETLPKDWMRDSSTPSKGAAYYGYLWWLGEEGSYSARGIFQQRIAVLPASQVVIAVHSNAPTAIGGDYAKHVNGVIEGLRVTLSR